MTDERRVKRKKYLPAVTDDNLGRVLVRHDNGRTGKSAPVGVHAVWLQGFLHHACVQVLSHFEHISVHKRHRNCSGGYSPLRITNCTSGGTAGHLLGHRGGLGGLLLAKIDRACVGVLEANGHSHAVLHEDSLASRDSRVLEVGI